MLIYLFFQVEINHAGEIDEIFDAISYRKGASVIRMLQSYLGAECFQVGFLVCYCSFFLNKVGVPGIKATVIVYENYA